MHCFRAEMPFPFLFNEVNMMKLRAAAKINLMLDIFSKTDDGYHSLFMIMQSVSLYDDITVTDNDAGVIRVSCSRGDLPSDMSNTAYKAASLYSCLAGIRPGFDIFIQKNIPAAAGLAGGSADAAAVIKALSVMHPCDADTKQLDAIAEQVGADVPFCLHGGTKAAFDKGQVLADIPPLFSCFAVLVKPDIDVSTGLAYSLFDSAQNVRHLKTDLMLNACVRQNKEDVCAYAGNVFEQFVEVHDRPYIKSVMRKYGSFLECMSGSGPTVYGLFDDEKSACLAASELKKTYSQVYVCTPVNEGVLI